VRLLALDLHARGRVGHAELDQLPAAAGGARRVLVDAPAVDRELVDGELGVGLDRPVAGRVLAGLEVHDDDVAVPVQLEAVGAAGEGHGLPVVQSYVGPERDLDVDQPPRVGDVPGDEPLERRPDPRVLALACPLHPEAQPAPDRVDVLHQDVNVGRQVGGGHALGEGVDDLADVGGLVGGRDAAGLAGEEPLRRALEQPVEDARRDRHRLRRVAQRRH